jgi:mannose-6-phosphate isomerase-like protein (cupin superfamily)
VILDGVRRDDEGLGHLGTGEAPGPGGSRPRARGRLRRTPRGGPLQNARPSPARGRRRPGRLHVHHDEDEWFYVLGGELTIWVAGQTVVASAGSFVFGPRDVPHTFIVSSDEARFLLVTHRRQGSRASSARSGPPLSSRRSRPRRPRRPTWSRYCRPPPTTASRSSALPAFRPELRITDQVRGAPRVRGLSARMVLVAFSLTRSCRSSENSPGPSSVARSSSISLTA